MRCLVVALALLVFPAGAEIALAQQAGPVSELIRAQTELIARTREYRESLEPVLGFQEAEATRAEAQARSHASCSIGLVAAGTWRRSTACPGLPRPWTNAPAHGQADA